ncbi:DUF4157 domain-containing protein [Archangium minus]|uniref:DUF4157 domain-containing protein n=1 Tax=Archangium minus TaxID=83450 RepID=A0ABY9WX26_9BACT|nr:DUF4157 domain-containing protein [Archangium minus]
MVRSYSGRLPPSTHSPAERGRVSSSLAAEPPRPSKRESPAARTLDPAPFAWSFDQVRVFPSPSAPPVAGARLQAREGSLKRPDALFIAHQGLRAGPQPLPYLEAIQASFGRYELGPVSAHIGGPAEQANRQLQALAYTTGDHVAFRQPPDLRTAAHEAAHVVQQRSGVRLSNGLGRSGDRHEQQADAVAEAVVGGRSAEPLLEGLGAASSRRSVDTGSAVQCKGTIPTAGGGWEFSMDVGRTTFKVGTNDEGSEWQGGVETLIHKKDFGPKTFKIRAVPMFANGGVEAKLGGESRVDQPGPSSGYVSLSAKGLVSAGWISEAKHSAAPVDAMDKEDVPGYEVGIGGGFEGGTKLSIPLSTPEGQNVILSAPIEVSFFLSARAKAGLGSFSLGPEIKKTLYKYKLGEASLTLRRDGQSQFKFEDTSNSNQLEHLGEEVYEAAKEAARRSTLNTLNDLGDRAPRPVQEVAEGIGSWMESDQAHAIADAVEKIAPQEVLDAALDTVSWIFEGETVTDARARELEAWMEEAERANQAQASRRSAQEALMGLSPGAQASAQQQARLQAEQRKTEREAAAIRLLPSLDSARRTAAAAASRYNLLTSTGRAEEVKPEARRKYGQGFTQLALGDQAYRRFKELRAHPDVEPLALQQQADQVLGLYLAAESLFLQGNRLQG